MKGPLTYPGSSMREHQRGTVLLVTTVVIISVAGMSAVMLMRSQNNLVTYQQDHREVQAEYVAESAVSFGMNELNNSWLPKNLDVGSMSNTEYVLHSGDDDHAPIRPKDSGLRGHPKRDGIDNDRDGNLSDKPSDNNLIDASEDPVNDQGSYRGGIYRVRVREWVKQPTDSDNCPGGGEIGAEDMDDDGDGQVDECDEVNGYTNSSSRKFTMVVEASYGNYTIEKRVYSNAIQTSAGKFGIYSKGDLTIKPKSEIDSYDSVPYTKTQGRNNLQGNIGAEEDLTVAKNADVYGDAEYGQSKDIKNPDAVHGEIRPLGTEPNHTTWSLQRTFKNTSNTETVSAADGQVFINNDLEKLTVEKGGTAVIQNKKNGQPITIGPDYNKKNAPVAVSSGSTSGGGGKGGGGGTGNSSGGSTTPATIKVQSQSQVFIQGGWEDGAATDIVLNGPTSPSKTPTRIYISDRFETNNRTDITVNGRVEMKVVKSVDIGSKSEVDVTTDKTPHFSLQVGGTWNTSSGNHEEVSSPGDKVRIKPKGTWQGVISAPALQGKNAMTLFPNTEYFGALIGRNVTLKPDTEFHYDERVSTSCYLPSVNCSWVSANSNSWVVAQRGGAMTQ